METNLEYGVERQLEVPMEEALERTRAALQREGFGVLFEIDLDEKLINQYERMFSNSKIITAEKQITPAAAGTAAKVVELFE